VVSLNGGLNGASAGAVAVAVIVAVVVGYPVIWETLTRGRSPGKLALGLRVVSDDGGPERFRQALVRGLAAAVEIWMFLGCPALICSLLSVRGKRLGDLFAGTFVIQQRLPVKRSAAPPVTMTPELAHWATALEMSRLSEQTAATARRYLARLPELRPAARAELGERIAAAVRSQVSPPPPPGMPVPVYLSAVLAERHNREQTRLAGVTVPEYAAPPGTVPPGTVPPGTVAARTVSGGQPGVGERPPPGQSRPPDTGGFVPPA
jgi:RDD family protein